MVSLVLLLQRGETLVEGRTGKLHLATFDFAAEPLDDNVNPVKVKVAVSSSLFELAVGLAGPFRNKSSGLFEAIVTTIFGGQNTSWGK